MEKKVEKGSVVGFFVVAVANLLLLICTAPH